MGINATVHLKKGGKWLPATPEDFGSGGTTTVTDPGGAEASLPLTVTMTDGTERIVGMQGVALPRSVGIEPVSGDTVTLKYRYASTGAWFTLGAYTANSQEILDAPIQALSIQRTAGTGTTSKVVIA